MLRGPRRRTESLLFAAAAMRVALKAREVQVPDLVNRTANEATAVAGEIGLSVKPVNKYDYTKPHRLKK